jgi:ABC-type uncharacterized transport system auxiliary subunit
MNVRHIPFARCLVFGALALVAAGCINLSSLTQPPIQTAYYILEYDPPAPTGSKPSAPAIRVDRFSADPLYATTAMIYKKQPFQTDAYVYHRWHTAPADMVSHLLARDLRRSGNFAAVFGPAAPASAAYDIKGHVEIFLENDTADPWQAELLLTVTVTGPPGTGNSAVVLQKSYQASAPCVRNHPRAFAEAMSRAMQLLSEEIIADVSLIVTNQ